MIRVTHTCSPASTRAQYSLLKIPDQCIHPYRFLGEEPNNSESSTVRRIDDSEVVVAFLKHEELCYYVGEIDAKEEMGEEEQPLGALSVRGEEMEEGRRERVLQEQPILGMCNFCSSSFQPAIFFVCIEMRERSSMRSLHTSSYRVPTSR